MVTAAERYSRPRRRGRISPQRWCPLCRRGRDHLGRHVQWRTWPLPPGLGGRL